MKICIKKLSDSEWDFYRVPPYCRRMDIDGHIRKEGPGYTLDVFDAGIKDKAAAHQQTYTLKSRRGDNYGPDWSAAIAIITEFELRKIAP